MTGAVILPRLGADRGHDHCDGAEMLVGVELESLADVVERLFAVYEPALSLGAIVAVVRRCRRELDLGATAPSLSRVEELARTRLADLVSLPTVSRPGRDAEFAVTGELVAGA